MGNNQGIAMVKEVLTPRLAMEEAARCLLCSDAPCSKGCPAKTNPAKFIRSLRFRNEKGAAETIRENNPLGGVCGYICPTEKLCEKACSRCGIDRAIAIGEIQKYVIQQEVLYGMKILKAPSEKNKKKIACVGSGPASLTVASILAQQGFEVAVYEKEEKFGGVLRYGIVPSRLPESIVNYEINLVKELGVTFFNNQEVGKDIYLADLAETFDAVFVGVGLGDSKKLALPGSELEGVRTASEYLKSAWKKSFYSGGRVVVIGGGDVAMDCAITAKNHGCEVSIVYRRSLEEAPANRAELKDVMSEKNIPIMTNFAPLHFEGEDGLLRKIHFKGRFDDSEMSICCDTVVLAIGQQPDEFIEETFLNEEKSNYLTVDDTFMTKMTGVFSGGDVVNGGKTVVEAVAMGKKVAESIQNFVLGESEEV